MQQQATTSSPVFQKVMLTCCMGRLMVWEASVSMLAAVSWSCPMGLVSSGLRRQDTKGWVLPGVGSPWQGSRPGLCPWCSTPVIPEVGKMDAGEASADGLDLSMGISADIIGRYSLGLQTFILSLSLSEGQLQNWLHVDYKQTHGMSEWLSLLRGMAYSVMK